MALPALVVLVCLLSIAYAAPTYPVQSMNSPLMVNSFYNQLMENVCSDLTAKACLDHDGYAFRYSIFDPVARFCVCSTKPSQVVVNKKCPGITCLPDRPAAYYWPSSELCFCEIEDFFALPWNYFLSDGGRISMQAAKSILEGERNERLIQDEIGDSAQAEVPPTRSDGALPMLDQKMVQTFETSPYVEDEVKVYKRQNSSTASPTQTATDTVVPTFVPPPKEDLTPELLNQSLSTQHQNTAKVASVIAHLADEVITVLVQLDGIVANLIAMNASTTFPCGSIGSKPEPNIMLVPKHVQGGTQQTIIANCRCIAVNQLEPDLINWWVLNQLDGSLLSLAGKAEVTDIDKIDTGAPIALSMFAGSVSPSKREDVASANIIELPRRQVLKADICDRRCPAGMKPIPGDLLKNPPQCGCLAQEPREFPKLAMRGLSTPGPYTAVMDEAACIAMKCTNNNDKPAMWNPFDMQCWCAGPTFLEHNENAWSPDGPVKD